MAAKKKATPKKKAATKKKTAAPPVKRRRKKIRTKKKVPDKGTVSDILTDPKSTRRDIKLIERAAKNRWPTAPDKMEMVFDRLFQISQKTSVDVVTKDGTVVSVDEPADKNAIAASGVMIKMESMNQKDEHLERRIATQQARPAPIVNVGVNVDNRPDQHASRMAELAAALGIEYAPGTGNAEEESGSVEADRPAVTVKKRKR